MSDFSHTAIITCPKCKSKTRVAPDDGVFCPCGWDENDCQECAKSEFGGCIEHSPCCGAHIIENSDCCSDCKEHTCIENI